MSNEKFLGIRFLNIIFLAIVGFAASGCVRNIHYTPGPDRNFEPIPEFSSSNVVVLVNAQPSTDETLYADTGGARFYANLNAWTDVAITIAKRELENRGMHVTTAQEGMAARKILKLSVEDADKIITFATLASTIDLKVETGDGYSETYVGRNKCGFACSHENQVDGAMMRAVVAMLRDPLIIKYITSPE